MNSHTSPKRITAISLDYDDCGDVLFEELKEYFKNLPEERRLLKECKDKFVNYLDQITADSDVTELYVGSIRQDIASDKFNMNKNQNGSCFSNYQLLCNEKKWVFRRFLLADHQNNLKPGTTMRGHFIMSSIIKSKVELIQAQLLNIKKNHPDDIVDFYFFDDDFDDCLLMEIAESLKHYPIPHNIENITLGKYDWFSKVVNKQPDSILSVHTVISQKFTQTTSELNHQKISTSQFIKTTRIFSPPEIIMKKNKYDVPDELKKIPKRDNPGFLSLFSWRKEEKLDEREVSEERKCCCFFRS
jgi:hypothetical protein